MSQKLIGIIGAATVAVALATPVHAQVECANWNTASFFEVAKVSDVTRCLREEGAVPVARDSLGNTPLHSAAPWGTAETVTALLEAGADPHARNEGGYTPLHMAAIFGTAETVTTLLDSGADLEARDGFFGNTPLHSAPTWGNDETVTAVQRQLLFPLTTIRIPV